jgi:hypothetical protein
MVVDPRRTLFLGAVALAAIGLLIHFVALSSPRYCDHLGWCATNPTYIPGQPVIK